MPKCRAPAVCSSPCFRDYALVDKAKFVETPSPEPASFEQARLGRPIGYIERLLKNAFTRKA